MPAPIAVPAMKQIPLSIEPVFGVSSNSGAPEIFLIGIDPILILSYSILSEQEQGSGFDEDRGSSGLYFVWRVRNSA